MSKSKTLKRKAKVLKPGSKLKMEAIVKILGKERFDAPTVNGEVFILKIIGETGPFKGQAINMIVHESEDLNMLEKAPWIQRVIMKVWETFVWNKALTKAPA
jgi:hypothetical protein